MYRFLQKIVRARKVNKTTDTTQQDHSLISGFQAGAKFDDQLDLDHEMTQREAIMMILRGATYVKAVWGLFLTKWMMGVVMIVPGLFYPWFGKIITDHIILGVPLVVGEAAFPPHMDWLLRILEPMERIEMLIFITICWLIGMFFIGTTIGGTGAGTYGGRDNASNAENAISGGGSGAGGLYGIAEWWIDVRLTQRFVNSLRRDLYYRLVRAPMTTIDDHRTGDSLYRTLYDTPMVYTCLTEITYSPFWTLWSLGIVFYSLWWTYADVSIQLVGLVALMMPITIITTLAPSKWIRRVTQNHRAAAAATTNTLEETMNNIGAVQSLGAMKQEKEKFAQRSGHAFWRARLQAIPWTGVEMIIEAAGWPIGFYLSWLVSNMVIDGILTVGDFGAMFGMYMLLRGRFIGIGRMWLNLQDQAAAARRVFVFMDRITDDEMHNDQNKLPQITRSVRLENVDFTYPNGHEALKNIDLEMRMNQVVAFVGPTGSGKTSLAYLIPSFIKPTNGRVLIDNHDVMKVDLKSLRDQIAYIFQEHFLLSESIRSNLLFANPNASEEELIKALETARCMEFIEDLSDGLDTILGQSGDTLSVGQQQRLCIARGLVRDSKILILDEPTAALDPFTENALVSSLREAAKNKLVIVIAHRMSTIRQADQIVFIDEGVVKEVGDHETLMNRTDGPYREFVNLQTSTAQ
ncbi:MAG: ABC transporter ATP-binding protein [Gammaproteobacteria bacterium]|nr:ABC transporter ATP-binding protein [Gammaproteobacteria bacterium]